MDVDRLRLFVAVPAPPAVQSAVAAAEDGLRAQAAGAVRFGNPADAHVTLHFLGSTPSGRVEELAGALAPVAAATRPFTLRTGAFGAFPSRHRARVVWLGLDGEVTALGALQRAVVAALVPLGFAPEPARFTAHLTLGRLPDRATRAQQQAVADALRTIAPPQAAAWPVRELCLMSSGTRADGPRYRSVGRWPLSAGP